MHKVLAEQLGADWRSRFAEFDDTPAAAASIGQVHRAVWKGRAKGGRPVAVKIQYPGAGEALLADLKQLSRLAAMFKVDPARASTSSRCSPSCATRIIEELDYELEAEAQRAFAAAYADDDEILVPEVVAPAPRVLVTEWIDGTPLSKIIAGGTRGGARPRRLR